MTYFNGPARNGAVFTNRTTYIRLIFYSFYFILIREEEIRHFIIFYSFYFILIREEEIRHFIISLLTTTPELLITSLFCWGRGEVLTFVIKIFRNLQRYTCMTHEFGFMIWVLDRSKVYHPRKATIISTI